MWMEGSSHGDSKAQAETHVYLGCLIENRTQCTHHNGMLDRTLLLDVSAAHTPRISIHLNRRHGIKPSFTLPCDSHPPGCGTAAWGYLRTNAAPCSTTPSHNCSNSTLAPFHHVDPPENNTGSYAHLLLSIEAHGQTGFPHNLPAPTPVHPCGLQVCPSHFENVISAFPEVPALFVPLFVLLEPETSREAGSSNFILLDVSRWFGHRLSSFDTCEQFELKATQVWFLLDIPVLPL